ncbi:glycosyltransferase family 2 protein [Burkholderia cenocepacia]|uniref:glycosyltransferase family 2 protein n=1 Tax=Burkholderia cepacia complex TaxID=87882 RepID=UPI000F584E98|nr:MULTISPECIES: glycosyltransferase family 2 protein [Burkholderia cepacia complex]ELW9446223.1 glycosyltransferase family 2 protein [Burkholderia cenocepacia]MBR8482113.1 glycosyltransferase family 2 protein [Burkholderia cenocepacia]MDN7470822.1 glycosyltransferase family 2 protein [Burkholderia orbicola]MDN7503900.1 glycosyltransferase family 2 protein [Burkholderia orbicola]RQU11789.1 glycosyltransferase family 2 protein [Burkholderia cenocepacia]
MKLRKARSFVNRVAGDGGLRLVVRKAYGIFRREGVAGIRSRIAWLRAGAPGVIDPVLYAEWVRRYDQVDDATRAAIRERIAGFANPPLISVVMPVYNPDPAWLAEAIESIRGQLYPHWELCIADDVSTNPAIRPLLERYAAQDPRIKVAFRQKNGHISAASNTALELVTGTWVALFDHDDLLPEQALYCVADVIVRDPSIRMIYSDEDKIDGSGKRREPYFKCDWNPDLFLSQNMFSHLGVFQKALLDEVGGFREGYEGSQDYDLALRCVERAGAAAIHHIPRVLYHWRVHAESTSSGTDAKPYAVVAGERALNDHFERTGVRGVAEYAGNGYRARYALPDPAPLVSLIIPTRNGLNLIRQCITSIVGKTTYARYEIIIVDNGSDDPDTLNYLASLENDVRFRILRDDRPFNFAALCNTAVEVASGEVVGLVNNDIEVISPDWLTEMVSIALQPGVGAVGAKLLYPNDTVQHAGVVLGLGGVAGHVHKHIPRGSFGYFGRASLIGAFSAVTAACMIVRKAAYREVAGMNERDLGVAFNDIDFCLRLLKAGYRNVWTPYAELYHHESATRGYEDDPVKQARFDGETEYMQKHWGELLRSDSSYSPNLTLNEEDIGLAWPSRVGALV